MKSSTKKSQPKKVISCQFFCNKFRIIFSWSLCFFLLIADQKFLTSVSFMNHQQKLVEGHFLRFKDFLLQQIIHVSWIRLTGEMTYEVMSGTKKIGPSFSGDVRNPWKNLLVFSDVWDQINCLGGFSCWPDLQQVLPVLFPPSSLWHSLSDAWTLFVRGKLRLACRGTAPALEMTHSVALTVLIGEEEGLTWHCFPCLLGKEDVALFV